MNIRKQAIGLAIFLVVTTVMTWLVYATLQRQVTGETTEYAAEFTDVFGLREGDDVRMAGVRVGRVSRIELGGEPGHSTARVDFALQNDQKIMANTEAAILYQNIVGQRYLDLRLGKVGDSTPLPGGTVIPLSAPSPPSTSGSSSTGTSRCSPPSTPKPRIRSPRPPSRHCRETPPRGQPWSTSPARSPRPSPVATNCWAT